VVQMAKILGARVIATAAAIRRPQLPRPGRRLAINYKTQNVAAAIRSLPRGCQRLVETVREPDFDKVISLLALRGG